MKSNGFEMQIAARRDVFDFLVSMLAAIFLIEACLGTAVAQTITTFAGGGVGDGGAATSANLNSPAAVAIDAEGNVYIADYSHHRVRKITLAGTISTVAGNGSYGFSGDGGPATSASLAYPNGLAIDSAGNLFIADSANYRVRGVSPLGVIFTVAGNGSGGFSGDGGPATSASLMPNDLAVDGAGNLYIAESNNHRIRKVNSTGVISTVAGNGVAGFSGDGGAATSANLYSPSGVALDAAGNVYFAEYGNHRVRQVTPAGVISTVVGNGSGGFSGDGGAATSASLNNPVRVSIDAAGNLYIADRNNRRIRIVTPAGVISTVAGNGSYGFGGDGGSATSAYLADPMGVAIDAVGNLYVADFGNHRIRQVTSAGVISTAAGNGLIEGGFSGDGGSATSARLYNPMGVVIDGVGNLYLADFSNHRIRKVTPAGVISTVAGNGSPGFSGDSGAGTSANLNNPLGVAIDAAGNLYIADYSNQRIRKVTPAGVITTVAGNGSSGFGGDGGPATSASFAGPVGVAIDGVDNLYVVDNSNQRIRKVTPAGVISTVVGNGSYGFSGDGGPATSASLANPLGVAIDAAGNLYISEQGNQRIRKVTSAGVISTVAGNGSAGYSGDGGPATSAKLFNPRGVATDAAGNLYIADDSNNRVRKVTPAGVISTVAGNGIYGFSSDDSGPATSTRLANPSQVATDAAGNLYISDRINHRIRKVQWTAPDAPLIGASMAGNGSVSVSFTAPSSDGGSPITGYTATCGGASSTGTSSPITVAGLANGTAVTCTVTATNAVGTSTASAASNSVTPATVPGAPTIGTASPGDANATVTFAAPASNGGSAITSYAATCGTQTATATTSPITVTGLTNGTAVTCTVTATNAMGMGTASAASNSVTPATVPDAPTIGTATPGNASATVTFTAPLSNGGSTIASYTATCGTKSAAAATSPITVGGLANGSAVTCTVTATNAIGTGAPSAASNAVTPDGTPPDTSITSNPPAVTNSTSAAFSFTGNDAGGSGVASFECKSDAGSFAACTSPHALTGLSAAVHTFQVRAIDAVGNVDMTPATFSWAVDTTTPTLAIALKPAITAANQATYSVAGTCSEDGRMVNVQIGSIAAGGVCGGTTTGQFATAEVDVSSLAQGAVSLTATLIDAAGNSTSVSDSTTKDSVGPTLTIGTLDTINNANKAAYAFAGNCETGGGTVSFSLTSTAVVSGTASCTAGGYAVTGLAVSNLADGTVSFSVTQADSAGNSTTTTGSVLKDTLNPTVAIDAPAMINAANQARYVVTGNCSEAGRAVTVSVGTVNGAGTCGAPSAGLFQTGALDLTGLSQGSVAVNASFSDAAGNTASATASTTKDTSSSAPSITSPASGATVASNPAISGTGAESGASVTVKEGTSTVCTATAAAGGSWSCNSSLGVGTHSLTASQVDAVGNTSAASAVVTFSVKLTPTLTLASSANPSSFGQSVTFTASTVGASGASGTVVFTDGSTAIGGCASVPVASGSALCTTSSLAAGSHGITAEYSGDGNYNAATSSTLAQSVASASQTISFGSLADRVYGASPFAISATATSGLPVTFTSLTTSVCTVSSTTVTLVGVGACTIAANQSGDSTYAAAPQVTQSFNVGKVAQSIAFTAIPNHRIGDAPFALGANASSGLPVTFGPTTPSVCSVAGSTASVVAPGTCSITASQPGDATYLPAPDVVQTFIVEAALPGISLSPSSLDFGGQSLRTTSREQTVVVTNTGAGTLTIASAAASAPFAVTSGCATIQPGAACGIRLTFTPLAEGAATGPLTISHDAPGGTATVALAGTGEKSLVTHFYDAILARLPDAEGKTFWEMEAERLEALGANLNETWFVMALAFFNSPEYSELKSADREFLTDLYLTFYNRPGDAEGLAYWSDQLAKGMSRENVLLAFLFSKEFVDFTRNIFGEAAVRAEIDLVMDFYRGVLGRLPDTDGFKYWLARLRAAQCAGPAQVTAEADAFSAMFFNLLEYGNRKRTDAQYVADLYNTFMRRAGDLEGQLFWEKQLADKALTREQLREAFLSSAEFNRRVATVAGLTCLP